MHQTPMNPRYCMQTLASGCQMRTGGAAYLISAQTTNRWHLSANISVCHQTSAYRPRYLKKPVIIKSHRTRSG